MRALPVLGLLGALTVWAAGCSKKDAPQASLSASASVSSAPPSSGGADAGGAELWAAAIGLAPEDLSRLALREGSAGLVAGGADPARRRVAVAALQFADDLEGLPLLAEVAASGDAESAELATQAAETLAARPRRAIDPEDALEVRAGCDRLRDVIKDKAKPKALRYRIARTLRMLEDRGCAKDLPTVE